MDWAHSRWKLLSSITTVSPFSSFRMDHFSRVATAFRAGQGRGGRPTHGWARPQLLDPTNVANMSKATKMLSVTDTAIRGAIRHLFCGRSRLPNSFIIITVTSAKSEATKVVTFDRGNSSGVRKGICGPLRKLGEQWLCVMAAGVWGGGLGVQQYYNINGHARLTNT